MIKVKVRAKSISGNRLTLYLDFYPGIINSKTGKLTRREFLGLYVSDSPKNQSEKKHNKDVYTIAERIREKRVLELNKPEIYTGFEKEQLAVKERGQQCFVKYFRQLARKKKTSNYGNWLSCQNYLEAFTDGAWLFENVTESFCEDFKEHLLNVPSKKSNKSMLAKNSALSYFNKFKAALKQAYKDGFLKTDINSKVSPIKQEETHRKFLTLEELNRLVKAECSIPVLKQAALFSALTGLRFSDIEKMLWAEIEFINGQGYFIHFRQEKSEGVEAMPISEQAFSLLGDRRNGLDKVFEGLVYSAWTNAHLFKWLVNGGITKHITFHCFRHTYATLQLSHGTDIYTVSKMLGHRELKTTQLYAKIIDKTKRDASDKLRLDI